MPNNVSSVESQLPPNLTYNAKIEGWGFEDIDGKKTVIYNITIIASNGATWCVRRRFSEFRDNYLTISQQFPRSKVAISFKFPSRTLLKSIGKAEERKNTLQEYLDLLLKIHPPPLETMYFLRMTRKVLGLGNIGQDSIKPHVPPIGSPAHGAAVRSSSITSASPLADGRVPRQSAGLPRGEEDEFVENLSDSSEDEAAERYAMCAPAEKPDATLRRRRPSQRRKGEEGHDGGEGDTVEHTGHHTIEYAQEELEKLSDDSEDDENSSTMGDEEMQQRKNMIKIRRNAEVMLRDRTMHTVAVLRPYTMGHHIALVEAGEDEHDELADAVINARARVEAMVVFIFYGSLICLSRLICVLIDTYIQTYSSHPTWNPFSRQGWYDIVRYCGIVVRNGVVSYWESHHVGMSYILKTAVFIIFVQATFHRVLGWALSEWLFNLLGTPKGAFKMTFGSVVLRLGIVYNDSNEILVNNFVWHNTPRFKQTPYFAKIKTLRLKFCLVSVIDAIRYRTPIKITEFVIDGLTLHIERGKRQVDGLNLWAVLGADSVEESIEVKDGVLTKIARAAAGSTSSVTNAGKGMVKGVYSGAKGTATGAYRGVKMVGGVAMKYNPVTMGWSAIQGRKSNNEDSLDDHDDDHGESSADNVYPDGDDDLVDMGEVDDAVKEEELDKVSMSMKGSKQRKKKTSGKRLSDRMRISASSIGDLMFDEEDTDSDSDFEYDTSDNEGFEEEMREMAKRSAELGAGVGDSLFVARGDAFERRRQRVIRNRGREMRREQREAGKDLNELPELEPHWGVPYKFDCKRFTGRNLTFYVKDYLAAKHTKHAPIVIPIMEMDATEVGLFHYSGMFGGKRYAKGLYLDDLIWRVINRLIGDLLKTNAFSLLSTVGASGLNQAKNTMIGGAKGGLSSTMEVMYNYNPNTFSQAAMKTLHKVKSIGAPKLPRSPSVQDLHVDVLKVAVLAIRGFVVNGQEFSGPITVRLVLHNQPGQDDDSKIYEKKTAAGVPDHERDGNDKLVYKFGEAFEIENLTTLNAELSVRVYPSTVLMATEKYLAEVSLPIRDDVSPLIDEASGRVLKENKVLMPWENDDGSHFTTFLPGIREEKSCWYLLYAKESDTICGEVLLSMSLI